MYTDGDVGSLNESFLCREKLVRGAPQSMWGILVGVAFSIRTRTISSSLKPHRIDRSKNIIPFNR